MSNDYILNLSSEELDKYKAVVLNLMEENERLKALCDTYFSCYRAKHNDIEGNLFSYRKALEEVREMCSNTCEKNKDCIHSCYECKSIDEPVAINRILNKINEVLGNEMDR